MSNSKRPTPSKETKDALDILGGKRPEPNQATLDALQSLKSDRLTPSDQTKESLDMLKKHKEQQILREKNARLDDPRSRATVVLPKNKPQNDVFNADGKRPKAVNSMNEQSQNVAPGQKRPVALIDMDGTLIRMGKSDGRTVLNDALIESLRKNEIKDIYLFTNMDLSTLQDEVLGNIEVSRFQLIEQLKQAGFTVHGVITPPDVSYAFVNPNTPTLGAVYNDFYLEQRKRVEYYIDRHESTNPNDIKLARDGKPDFSEKEFVEKMTQVSALKMQTTQKLPKFAEEIEKNDKAVDSKKSNFNIKGIMYDFFLENKPNWVGSAIVIDDEESCINTIQKVSDVKGTSLPLTTVTIPSPLNPNEDSFSMSNYQKNITGYDNIIHQHLEKTGDKVYLELKKLTDQVQQFKDSHKEIKGFFEKLKHKKDIKQLTNAIDQILNSHFTNKQKLTAITAEIQKVWDTQKNKHSKKLFFFDSKKSLPEKLQEKPKKYHFERMLGLLLKNLQQDTQISEVKTQLRSNPEISQIQVPENQAYNGFKR